MIVNLIKSQQMFSLTLPSKVKGQYWISDIALNGKRRELISVEARNGEWVLKSNRTVSVLNSENKPVDHTVLYPQSFFNLKVADDEKRVILFAENVDESRQFFRKVIAQTPDTYYIGRTNDNHFCYENRFVSGKHARLSYDGANWSITDTGSTNGTYVNGYRIESQNLYPGDIVYIMGLILVIGRNFLAVNNPDGRLQIRTGSLVEYRPQPIQTNVKLAELPEKQYFYRSPRFHREVEPTEIKIDPPPQLQKQDTVPLALMLGPSITMGLTSLSTGILTLNNVLVSGGEISQALPTLFMSVSMLLGTVLWPILTKKYEKKNRIKSERRRQEKYLAYLDTIRDEIKRCCKEQSDILQENMITLEECAGRIAQERPNLWERMLGQKDFLNLRLGVGSLPLAAQIKYPEKKFTMEDDALQDAMFSLGSEPKQLSQVPIGVSLVENISMGIYGSYPQRTDLLKSLILQMVSLHSYDELKIMLLCEEEEKLVWDFVRPIPHFWNDDKTVRFLACNADEVKEISAFIENNILVREDDNRQSYTEFTPYYVILVTSKELGEKCIALRQLLRYRNQRGFSVLVSAPELKDLPKEMKRVISLNGEKSRMFDREDTTGKGINFALDTVNTAAMAHLAQDVANIELDLSTQRYALPDSITFLEMFHVGKIEHLNALTRWKENNPTISLQTPIGVDSYGESFLLDLHEKYHGPHGLVAGMTGSGKSEFIITYILSMAVNYHPDEVAFILIDYKGGGLAGAFEDHDRGVKLPHLAGTITNLDGAAVKRSLISIQSELRRREMIFNEARRAANEATMDIYKYQQLYRDKVVSEPLPHLFIISDEFAELKTQQPVFMEQLISTARIGRSLGVHLILATQKPSGVVDDQIWSNSKFRICLKVQEKADSQDMIKCPDAAELSQTGRFYLQVGFNELFALGQSAWCGADYVPTETVEKTIDTSIQVVDNLGRVLASVKPAKKEEHQGNRMKQVVGIVKYLSDLAVEEKIRVRPLWLPPIPGEIYLANLEQKYHMHPQPFVLNPIVGEYDDPFNQKQAVLTIPFSQEGNCLIYGSTGNGKTTFLTTLCYSLLRHHSAEELNLYIMDFGAETLRVFENAPQVGGVMFSADEEKIVNALKMFRREIERRKQLFAPFGGDFASYCRNSGKTVPNLVVLLNNYSGFAEQFEELQEAFSSLTRDGVKYGLYFAVTAGNANAVRYRTQQNFKMMLTLQLNDAAEYAVIVGRTDGLVPSKYKGRGLIALDRVYEFQTAYSTNAEDSQEFLRSECQRLRQQATAFARPVPVLPKVVRGETVRPALDGLRQIPIGVDKKTLQPGCIDVTNKVVYPIVAQDLGECVSFLEEFLRVSSWAGKTIALDAEQLLTPFADVGNYEVITDHFEDFVVELFGEMVQRNNTYKDANLDLSVLAPYEERVYLIIGLKRFSQQLSDDGKDKLGVLLEKAESFYKLHFVIAETPAQWNGFQYDSWYKRQVSGTDGLWIGEGVADQYLLKLNKLTSELYQEVGSDYGYSIRRKRPALLKLLSSKSEEEAE